ncbi:MAG: hypothetical protein KDA84_00640, partial [Planctomycetaceae bacterium]|nr:hypothetical protein [Planctomycetaceae bacterium]
MTGQAPPKPPAPSQNDINKAKANQLMAAAKNDAEAGQFAAARQKLKTAESLDVVYSVHDERPELVLEDINRLDAQARNLARQSLAVPAAPQPNAQEVAKREKAQQLLKEARSAIRAGQFPVAEAKLNEARQLNATYHQFEDTPESVAALLKQLKQPVIEPSPSFPDFPEPSTPVVNKEPSAPSFPPAPSPSVEPKGNPFAAAPPAKQPNQPKVGAAGAFNLAQKAPAPPKTAGGVVHPSGPTATELFDRGLKHFNDGRVEEAYDAFLHCYRTGQRMDPYRTQSLQDMLQTLRPMIYKRANSRVQQVKNEEPGERRFGPGTDNDFNAKGGIDLVKKEQQLKYEKLRSETLNAIFQADRLRDQEKPTQALELIDRTLANVSDADLTQQQLTPLVRQLKVARSEIEAWQQQRAPILDLKERNAKVKEQIANERKTLVRVEQELAQMNEEYNTLFKQRRYAEAEVIAKKAKELAPENPVTEMMYWKAKFARRDARNQELRNEKEEGFWAALDSVERSAIPFDDSKPYQFGDLKRWEEITDRRKQYGTDNRIKTDKEQQIEKSLTRPISLHFTETPLNEVIKHVATSAGINVVVDNLGLSEEGILPDSPVSIDVDGIKLESALNLMLEPLHLSYMIQDEVLKVTSRIRQQGELEVVTYPVADLVVAIPSFKPSGGTGLQSSGFNNNAWQGPANFSVPAGGSLQPVSGAQFQVGDGIGGAGVANPWSAPGLDSTLAGGGSSVDFDTLSDLIVTTIEPDTWAEVGGSGSVRSYETTLSLVIRQTQKVHEEIRDLLEQLRRLQDLQVTIEVRFITVADRFFERIGIDFDFNVQDNVEGDDANLTPPAFGTNLGGPSFGNLQGQNQQGNQ